MSWVIHGFNRCFFLKLFIGACLSHISIYANFQLSPDISSSSRKPLRMSHEIRSLEKLSISKFFMSRNSSVVISHWLFGFFKFHMSVNKIVVSNCIFKNCTLTMKCSMGRKNDIQHRGGFIIHSCWLVNRAGASTRFTSTSTSTSTCNMCESEYESDYLITAWVRVRVLVDEYEYEYEYRPMIYILYKQQYCIFKSLKRESSDSYKPGKKL